MNGGRILVIVDGSRLTIYALDGVTATERASLLVEDTSPGSIATLVNGLSPFLAAGAPYRLAADLRQPLPVAAAAKVAPRRAPPPARPAPKRRGGPKGGLTLAEVVDYVRHHPGTTNREIADHFGVVPSRIPQVLGKAPEGLRYEKDTEANNSPRRWYVTGRSEQ